MSTESRTPPHRCAPLDSPGGSDRWAPVPPLLWVPGMVLQSLCWHRRPRPPCLPLAIPHSLLSAPWECVINICSVPHLEPALHRGPPSLRGSESLDGPRVGSSETSLPPPLVLRHSRTRSGVLAQAAVNTLSPIWGGSYLGPWASQAGGVSRVQECRPGQLRTPSGPRAGAEEEVGSGWGRCRGQK